MYFITDHQEKLRSSHYSESAFLFEPLTAFHVSVVETQSETESAFSASGLSAVHLQKMLSGWMDW